MSSPTRTALLASLLVIGAITLGLTRKPTNPEPNRPKTSIPTLTRTKLPNRHATVAQLLDSNRSHEELRTWANSLDDEDLKRLALELIDKHRSATAQTNLIPALTALAMEWGRRDFDEMMLECEIRVLNKQFGYSSDDYSLGPLIDSLRFAAAAGLAEDDPAEAWQRIKPVTSSDFFQRENENTKFATEVIFRNWAEQDLDTAWKEITSGISTTRLLEIPLALRGILAATSDPATRRTIIDWISKLEETKGSSISGVDMLGNPISIKTNSLRLAAGLGIAEVDPVAGYQIVLDRKITTNDGDVPLLGDIPIIGRLFQTPESDFLTQIAQRHPEAIPFILDSEIYARRAFDYESLAKGLMGHDPTTAIEMLAHIDDPTQRLLGFTDGVMDNLASRENAPWPMIAGVPQSLTYDQILHEISSNLTLLNLPPEQDTKAREAINHQFKRKELLEQTIPEE